MSQYIPHFGTDTYRMLAYVVEHAPFGGDKFAITGDIAEAVGVPPTRVHNAMATCMMRQHIIERGMVDGRMSWRAGRDAAEAIRLSAEQKPVKTMGFPNAKERVPVDFQPREGGAMDRAIKLLKAQEEDGRLEMEERELLSALALEGDVDLRTQFRPAIEAGALHWQVKPTADGHSLATFWSLGDGHPPVVAPKKSPRGPRKEMPARQAADVAEFNRRFEALAADAAQVNAGEPLPVVTLTTDLKSISIPTADIERYSVSRALPALPFRCGVFSDGKCTIQKGHGAVELTSAEVLELFEHIAPYAVRARAAT
jgi:hypothetical protein